MAGRVVRRIDHLFIAVEGADRVFDLLRSRLGLVELTPVTDWGAFRSGSFNLGNVFLEILEAMPGFPKASPDALEVIGIAFEPPGVDESRAEMARRGIPCLPPVEIAAPEFDVPFLDDPFGAEAPLPGTLLFTDLFMQGFADGNVVVFCCEHEAAPVASVREGMRKALDEVPERPLPVDGVEEVVIGATDFAAERDRWQQLLDPSAEREDGSWRFEEGPALRLIEHDRDAVVGLELHVEDLERAQRYLEDRDMLAWSSEAGLAIAPAALDGLSLTLVGDGRR